MRTLKKVTIVLDDGEQLEVKAGDVSVHIERGYRADDVDVIRIQRPPTDGRFLSVHWSALDGGGSPVLREGTVNGWAEIRSMTDERVR